ncbi:MULTISPECIES: BTAD domain-containing putative transcriptional regulator [Gordonia]|uniref:BTAD domain-containing putative transcriptional regulator n=1 Tax=Gordonia TaxID=2053 RepID=UPI00199ECCEB|nr:MULTISPECIES: BTAD domain-containing putative transcriptional regulator [Gordonia]MBD0024139.1 AAA family ATPase [Gordonia sp. (in: high G+C Gram-positive bacteria)]
MKFAILGHLEVTRDGVPVDLGTPKTRALLAALVLARPHAVSVDSLIGKLWGEKPPTSVMTTLQAYVSGLRRALEPDRKPREPSAVLLTRAPGYALELAPGSVDGDIFESVIGAADARRDGLAGLAADNLERLDSELAAALSLWRGEAYADLGDVALAERTRLDELRALGEELRLDVSTALGRHTAVVASAEALIARYPLRESLWRIRASALARCGRQAEALAVIDELRKVLDDELGLLPGPAIRELQSAILQQDSSISWTPATIGGPAPEAPARLSVPSRAEVSPPLPWPTAGRTAELAVLSAAWRRSLTGSTEFVVITGEPGIGKSRLVTEMMGAVVRDGALVGSARCSQDDGAPPLWPWTQILAQWGRELPTVSAPGHADDGAAFRLREQIVAAVLAESAGRPVLIAIDDLHWADPSTLRVLQLLGEIGDNAQLTVLLTWRGVDGTAGLAELSESLGRRHATRIDLDGLTPDAVGEVMRSVAGGVASDADAAQLADRTDGNPFFVVEYARLAQHSGSVSQLLAEPRPPTAVGEVIGRRIDRLGADTAQILQTAAVLGRAFTLPALCDMCGQDPDSTLDLLDTAVAAGLIREEGICEFVFAHALVRDHVYAALPPTRRARAHARAGQVLTDLDGGAREIAHHWLAAGPDHRDRAWRAARAAARQAAEVFADDESVELYTAALKALRAHRTPERNDEFELLLELAECHRRRGDWTALAEPLGEAVEIARRSGDGARLARACVLPSRGSAWFSVDMGEQNDLIVDALREALALLPETGCTREQSALRAEAMLALANETYYTSPAAGRRALVEAATGIATDLGDDRLELAANLAGQQALWSATNAAARLSMLERARELAIRVGDVDSRILATSLCANAHAQLGHPERMWPLLDIALDDARRRRRPFLVMVVLSTAVTWRAISGDFARARDLADEYFQLEHRVRLAQSPVAAMGIRLGVALWDGTLPALTQYLGGPADVLPVGCFRAALHIRAGQPEQARAAFADAPDPPLNTQDWYSLAEWATAGEIAAHLDLPELGVHAYGLLAPLAGWSVNAGAGTAIGPVDAFLALAAAATGDLELAARHADDAERLMDTWRIPPVRRWFAGERDRFGF